ncbi:hypothetical protein FB45DRAFT_805842 [Roridomyces roridus]|uniref:SET domain-containing protein n=1 Tax=Roridomyces roridus TaxID=1738132 RepID=A0AAD7F8F0_9AGAR|nr:hypothetical protein FB45DRAFT_805842 [Roridomyces roridus]
MSSVATSLAEPEKLRPSIRKPHVEVPAGYDKPCEFIERDSRLGSAPNSLTFTTVPFNASDDEPVTECVFFAGSKEVLMDLPGFPGPMMNPTTPVFRLAEARDKGFGLFSTRDLKAGQLILSERPLLVSARGIPVCAPPSFILAQRRQHTLNQLEKAVSFSVNHRMRVKDRDGFMALKNSHLHDGSGPVVGIMRTNGLSLEGLRPGVTDDLKSYNAVCENISRFNHSCSPNVDVRFDIQSFCYQVFAVRDIAAGAELTYSYVPIDRSTAQRNESLEPYDFVCTCTACQDPESDARRASLIDAGPPDVIKWLSSRGPESSNSLFDECSRQIKLMKREGMESTFRYLHVLAAGFEGCIALGDASGASGWAAKLWDLLWHWDHLPRNLYLFLDPASPAHRQHPLWRKRVDRDRTGS